ncbi:MAG: hypothetical protein Q7S87_01290 [Agitococcus sp.]|nr:hypothetical protein [Agitococcus sp.]
MQKITSKETLKKAVHRLHRKLKLSHAKATLSQAQELLAAVFGIKSFDLLLAEFTAECDTPLEHLVGVHVEHVKGADSWKELTGVSETQKEFDGNLLSYALMIQRDLLGGRFVLKQRTEVDMGVWEVVDNAILAEFVDCELVGGSEVHWLSKALSTEKAKIGRSNSTGTTDVAVFTISPDLSVSVVGVYEKDTMIGGYNYYDLFDTKTGAHLNEGNPFFYLPSLTEIRAYLHSRK